MQSITFACFLAPLKYNGVHHGWWKDRLGNPQHCDECQCNSKRPEWMEDEIGTQDLDMLPMKSFVYGPLEYDMEKANVSIGRLSCFGLKDSSDVSSFPEIVEEMKRIEGELIERTQTNRENLNTNLASIEDLQEKFQVPI